MAGRTPSEAVRAYIDPLQRALSCVTQGVLDVSGGYYAADRPHALTLAGGEPVRLPGSELWLSVSQNYRVVEWEGARGPWKVQTAGYFYGLDTAEGELLSFQWHPSGVSSYTRPHMHIGAGAGLRFEALQGAHIPTGRVALEEVLQLAVEELGAEPRREDWREVLDRTQTAFEEWRTSP